MPALVAEQTQSRIIALGRYKLFRFGGREQIHFVGSDSRYGVGIFIFMHISHRRLKYHAADLLADNVLLLVYERSEGAVYLNIAVDEDKAVVDIRALPG